MSITPSLPPPRHALGLPAGSIRALLAFTVLGLLWLLALRPVLGEKPIEYELPSAFVYLLILLVMILAHFFAAHGGSIRSTVSQRSPLGLPRGSVRFLLLCGTLGLGAYLYHEQPKFQEPSQSAFVLFFLLTISAFFLGHILTGALRSMSGGVVPFWFQDVQAWAALLSLGCLTVILIVQVFINPRVLEDTRINLSVLESILAALVGFYFGARS
jgi:hypothetical protein